MLHAAGEPAPRDFDREECAVKSSPASTFKIPHALIALETGVVTNPLDAVAWDRSAQPFTTWQRDHSLDSAIKWSVLWFFRRTAAAIGRERMLAHLRTLQFGDDAFERDVADFWVNGDLVVSPEEQLRFWRRLSRHELPARREHIEAVRAAALMPQGAITNASGRHPFVVNWKGPLVIRAKTGNTTVDGERVSWLVGEIETEGRSFVFVSRVRARGTLDGTAGAQLALERLNANPPGRSR
jgi:beta-lactamase class D